MSYAEELEAAKYRVVPPDRVAEEQARLDAIRRSEQGAAGSGLDELFVSVRDLVSAKPAGWIVKPLFQEGAFGLVLGQYKAGKSLLTVDMLLATARGCPEWFGYKIRKRRRVLYVNAEGSMTLRLRAYLKYHDLAPEAIPGFVVITRRIKLDAEGARGLRGAVELYESMHGTFDVVVVDTVARAMVGSESSDEDMTVFVDACESLLGDHKRTVIVVHHLGKDATRGSRGHTILPAAVATQLNVQHDSATGIRSFRVELQRDEEADPGRTFKLERVDLGVDDDGDEMASVVVVPDSNAPVRARPRAPSGKNMQTVYRVVSDLCAEMGTILPESSVIPKGVRAVQASAVITTAGSALLCEPKHKRQRVLEALDRLREQGFIGVVDPWVWVVRP